MRISLPNIVPHLEIQRWARGFFSSSMHVIWSRINMFIKAEVGTCFLSNYGAVYQ